MFAQCDTCPIRYDILLSHAVSSNHSSSNTNYTANTPSSANEMPLSAHFLVTLDPTQLPLLQDSSWIATKVTDMLQLHTNPDCPMKIISFTGTWTDLTLPSIPLFKKQFMLPYIQLVASSTSLTIHGSSHTMCRVFIIIDIKSRKLASTEYVTSLCTSLDELLLSTQQLQFIDRMSYAVSKSISYALQTMSSLCQSSSSRSTVPPKYSSSTQLFSSTLAASDFVANDQTFKFSSQTDCKCKSTPSFDEGYSVYEFFSGIGGMHLSLPHLIKGTPIRRVTAVDCSAVANSVYKHNFMRSSSRARSCESSSSSSSSRNCYLREILIDGIKANDIDKENAADIWTMSPPCQPYTKTRKSSQLGAADSRNRGFYHLLELLLNITLKPKWIVLENVANFGNSDVCDLFKRVLRHCGYSYNIYSLSPICLGIPNHRLRFYLIAEYGPRFDLNSMDNIHNSFVGSSSILPALRPIGEYIIKDDDDKSGISSQLILPVKILEASWASNRISIVSAYDTESFCFTKGYGRIIDKSTGSCLLMNATGPQADSNHSIDRSNLCLLYGQLRLFHPRELLAIAGFPSEFDLPLDMPLQKQFSCIGNSINVRVVTEVMRVLFE